MFVWARAHTYTSARVCVHMCGGQRQAWVLFFKSHPQFLSVRRQGFSLGSLGWLTKGVPWGSACFCLPGVGIPSLPDRSLIYISLYISSIISSI